MGPEQMVVNQILDYLTIKRIPHAHVRNTGAIIKRDGKTFFGRTRVSQKGVADILANVNAWPVAIEVKAKNKPRKPSPDQEIWGCHWEAEGGIYVVVNDLDQVMPLVDKLKTTRPGQGFIVERTWRKT